MTIGLASLILTVLGVYMAVGLIFGVAFIILGASKIDTASIKMPIRVRLLILPGVMLLWPLMMAKWITRKGPPIS
jgi:hypothetical protein